MSLCRCPGVRLPPFPGGLVTVMCILCLCIATFTVLPPFPGVGHSLSLKCYRHRNLEPEFFVDLNIGACDKLLWSQPFPGVGRSVTDYQFHSEARRLFQGIWSLATDAKQTRNFSGEQITVKQQNLVMVEGPAFG